MSQAGVGWDDLSAVAVTQGPGLIGALLVGLATAKSIAYRRGLPLIPVNHLQGHIAANYALGRRGAVRVPGRQRRAHAARRGGGGRALPRRRQDHGRRGRRGVRQGRPAAGSRATRAAGSSTSWRRAATRASPVFRAPCRAAAASASAASRRRCSTTSRLATRRRSRRIAPTSPPRTRRPSSASSSRRRVAGAAHEGLRRVAVAGGVAANSGLRRALTEACEAEGLQLSLPPLSLCTDNAGMIGLAAGFLPALPVPGLPRPRRLRQRRRGQGGAPASRTPGARRGCHSRAPLKAGTCRVPGIRVGHHDHPPRPHLCRPATHRPRVRPNSSDAAGLTHRRAVPEC